MDQVFFWFHGEMHKVSQLFSETSLESLLFEDVECKTEPVELRTGVLSVPVARNPVGAQSPCDYYLTTDSEQWTAPLGLNLVCQT